MLQILNIYRCTFVLYTMLFTFDLCVTSGGFNPVQRSQQDGWISGPELHQKLRRFMDDVIGYKTVQNILDDTSFSSAQLDSDQLINELSGKLESRFRDYTTAVLHTKEALLQSYGSIDTPNYGNLDPDVLQCCRMDNLQSDDRFSQRKVDTRSVCYSVQDGQDHLSVVPITDVYVDTVKTNAREFPDIKWQYYGTREGVTLRYPADNTYDCYEVEPRTSPWYVEVATSVEKDVVILIDQSVASDVIDISKEAARTVLDTMNPNDRIAIVAFNIEASTAIGTVLTDTCFSRNLANASPRNKGILKDFINQITSEGRSNYEAGFTKAFQYFRDSTVKTNARSLILLISDGELWQDEDYIYSYLAGMINSTFTQNSRTTQDDEQLDNSFVIHTFAVGSVNTEQEQLLRNIANQNWDHEPGEDFTAGIYTHIEDASNLKYQMASYNDLYSTSTSANAVITAPYIDGRGLGKILSVCTPVHYPPRTLAGVTCVDVVLEDILSDIEFYNFGATSYVFIIDSGGRTILHPRLPTVDKVGAAPLALDIKTLETHPQVQDVIESMKSKSSGTKQLSNAERLKQRGSHHISGFEKETVEATYQWAPIAGTDFSMCVVIFADDVKINVNYNGNDIDTNFLYNRLELQLDTDYISKDELCYNYGKAATLESSSVHFSARAFDDPYDSLTNIESKTDVQSYQNYMRGAPENGEGFREGVREMVALTGYLDDIWKTPSNDSDLLILRYIATIHGASRRYPGRSISKYYDALTRIWYKEAMAYTGSIIITPPYIDIAPEVGTVYTMSTTVYKGKPSGRHSTSEPVIGVISGDFRAVFVNRLLQDYTVCHEGDFRCFLVDSAGFLVYHDLFLQTDNVSYIHIIKEEPALALYLITENHMTQQSCVDLEGLNEQFSWQIKLTNNKNKIDNLASTPSFQMQSVPGTNIFIVAKVINDDNSYSAEQCQQCPYDASHETSCQLADGQCECPCAAPIQYDYCESKFADDNQYTSSCFPEVVTYQYLATRTTEEVLMSDYDINVQNLEVCFETRCDYILKQGDCKKNEKCGWCEISDRSKCIEKQSCQNPPDEDSGNLIIIVSSACASGLLGIIIVVVVCVVCKKKRRAAQKSEDRREDVYSTVDYSRDGEVYLSNDTLAPVCNTEPISGNEHPMSHNQQSIDQYDNQLLNYQMNAEPISNQQPSLSEINNYTHSARAGTSHADMTPHNTEHPTNGRNNALNQLHKATDADSPHSDRATGAAAPSSSLDMI